MKELYFEKMLVHSIFALIIMAGLYAMGIDIYPSDMPYILITILLTATADFVVKLAKTIIQILKESE